MNKEKLYQAIDFDTQKPIDIVVKEEERRQFQKAMMANDGLKGSGRWLTFIPYNIEK